MGDIILAILAIVIVAGNVWAWRDHKLHPLTREEIQRLRIKNLERMIQEEKSRQD